MQLFRYKEDRLPIALINLLFALDLAVFFIAEHWVIAAGWMLLGIIPKGYVCAWNHHHQHSFTFNQGFLNRSLELVYFFHTGLSSYGWVLHHVVGHHFNYLDQTKDESRWTRKNGKTMGELEYTIVVTLTSYYRAFKVGKKYPKYQKRYLLMGALSFGLLGVFFWANWVNALFVFALPMFISLMITSWATYDHHAGNDTEEEYSASNNILDPLYNKLTGNLGLHTAHHVNFGAHWSKLPAIHEEIEDKIPENCFYKPALPILISKVVFGIPNMARAMFGWMFTFRLMGPPS